MPLSRAYWLQKNPAVARWRRASYAIALILGMVGALVLVRIDSRFKGWTLVLSAVLAVVLFPILLIVGERLIKAGGRDNRSSS